MAKAPRDPSDPAPRATYHHGDLRRALVDAALAQIEAEGVDAFSLREAARRVGVNHRAAYRHFADRRDLLAAVAEQGWRELVEAMRDELVRLAGQPPEARLHGIGRAYVLFALSRRAHYAVMFGPRLNDDGSYPAIEAPIREAVAVLEAELRAALPSTRLVRDSVRDAGLSFWASLHGTATLLVTRRIRVKKTLLPGYLDTLLRPVIEGLVR